MTSWPECSRRRVTDAVESIRAQAPAARFVGEFAVKFLVGEINKRVGSFVAVATKPTSNGSDGASSAPSPETDDVSNHVGSAVPTVDPSGAPGIAGIPDYDIMGARELVTRLNELDHDTVRLVREAELAGRRRSTVINACDQLLGTIV